MANQTYITVTQAADQLNVTPRKLCDLLWSRKIDHTRCPKQGRTRLIPLDMLPEIKKLVTTKRLQLAAAR